MASWGEIAKLTSPISRSASSCKVSRSPWEGCTRDRVVSETVDQGLGRADKQRGMGTHVDGGIDTRVRWSCWSCEDRGDEAEEHRDGDGEFHVGMSSLLVPGSLVLVDDLFKRVLVEEVFVRGGVFVVGEEEIRRRGEMERHICILAISRVASNSLG